MLTIFATCKPFRGHNAVIQRNAIRSWTLLGNDVEVILLGDDEYTAEVAHEFGLRHIGDIPCNEYGTPLVSALFAQAEAAASFDRLCYVNADIILTTDFLASVQRLRWERFLMVGQRWDVEVEGPWPFDRPDWQERLRGHVARSGALHGISGLDYFAFSRGLYRDMPPFAVGRTAWDHWLIYHALRQGVPVIDASQAITAVHQNHDYGHTPGGVEGAWNGPEALRNQALAGDAAVFDIQDATWVTSPTGLRPALDPAHLRRRLATLTTLHPGLRRWTSLIRAALSLRGSPAQDHP